MTLEANEITLGKVPPVSVTHRAYSVAEGSATTAPARWDGPAYSVLVRPSIEPASPQGHHDLAPLTVLGNDIELSDTSGESDGPSSESETEFHNESEDRSTGSSEYDELEEGDQESEASDDESSVTLGSDTTSGNEGSDDESEWESGSDMQTDSSVESQMSTSDIGTDELMEEFVPYPTHRQRSVRFTRDDKESRPSTASGRHFRTRPLTPHPTYHPYERRGDSKIASNRTFLTADGRSSRLGFRDFRREKYMTGVAMGYLNGTQLHPIAGVSVGGSRAGTLSVHSEHHITEN